MGIFDKAREALQQHADKIDPVVDRLAGEADKRTGGKHGSHIERGADLAKDKLGDLARGGDASEPGQPR
ncbi:Rv0909 family putative TA system antitoxin [Microlunatus spumicola]